MKRTMVLLLLVEERDSEPPRYDATVEGAEVEEASAVRLLPKPTLTKCPAPNVVPFRKVAR
jgi:hypothetical protein